MLSTISPNTNNISHSESELFIVSKQGGYRPVSTNSHSSLALFLDGDEFCDVEAVEFFDEITEGEETSLARLIKLCR